jgi:hypothetical protein
MTPDEVPESITDFVHELARLRHPGAATFAARVLEQNSDPEIGEGELVIYARSNGKAVDGWTMVAISSGDQGIVFGRAAQAEMQVQLNDRLYPRHTVRGVVVATVRDISSEE